MPMWSLISFFFFLCYLNLALLFAMLFTGTLAFVCVFQFLLKFTDGKGKNNNIFHPTWR